MGSMSELSIRMIVMIVIVLLILGYVFIQNVLCPDLNEIGRYFFGCEEPELEKVCRNHTIVESFKYYSINLETINNLKKIIHKDNSTNPKACMDFPESTGYYILDCSYTIWVMNCTEERVQKRE